MLRSIMHRGVMHRTATHRTNDDRGKPVPGTPHGLESAAGVTATSIAATVPTNTDTAAGVDASGVGLKMTEAPSGNEVGKVTATSAQTETPTAADAGTIAATPATATETATGAENGSVTTSGGGSVHAKPPNTWILDTTDELYTGLTFFTPMNEGPGFNGIFDLVSGVQSPSDANMTWATLPTQTGLTLSGPYVDNIHAATPAIAKFSQTGAVLADTMWQGGWSTGATWAYLIKPPDGTTFVYVNDNSAQTPPNPTSGANAEVLNYINLNAGKIGETLHGTGNTNLFSSSGGEFPFNTTTLPWIFVVRVLHGGVAGGCDIYCNLDTGGNPISNLRLAVTIASADCAYSLNSNSSHASNGLPFTPVYGLNVLGVWGTAGLTGGKAGYAYAAVWNRVLSATRDGFGNVTAGQLFDLFASPCRMMKAP